MTAKKKITCNACGNIIRIPHLSKRYYTLTCPCGQKFSVSVMYQKDEKRCVKCARSVKVPLREELYS